MTDEDREAVRLAGEMLAAFSDRPMATILRACGVVAGDIAQVLKWDADQAIAVVSAYARRAEQFIPSIEGFSSSCQ
jgi:hypothetical protein